MSVELIDGKLGGEGDFLKVIETGPLDTNCYLYFSEGEVLVVDAAGEGLQLAQYLDGYKVVALVATHGHADHVGGMQALKDATGAPFYIAEADFERARKAGTPDMFGLCYDADAPADAIFVKEGDTLQVGTATFRVFECPGHTPGGIVLIGEGSAQDIAFVGDSLFRGSVGRCDLPGGDFAELKRSLSRLCDELGKDCKIYPGHGLPTDVKTEISTNPYLL